MSILLRRPLASSLLLSLLSMLLIVPTASAVLVDNGTTTVDTDTNLEWLDLTQTLNLSFADALNSTFVTVDGYRAATQAEVSELFTNAGILFESAATDPSNLAGAQALLNTLGCTLAPAVCATTSNPSGTGFYLWSGTSTGRRAIYRTDTIGGGGGAATTQSSFVTTANPEIGTFLVRVVPEPSTGLLLLGGLAALSARRRQALG